MAFGPGVADPSRRRHPVRSRMSFKLRPPESVSVPQWLQLLTFSQPADGNRTLAAGNALPPLLLPEREAAGALCLRWAFPTCRTQSHLPCRSALRETWTGAALQQRARLIPTTGTPSPRPRRLPSSCVYVSASLVGGGRAASGHRMRPTLCQFILMSKVTRGNGDSEDCSLARQSRHTQLKNVHHQAVGPSIAHPPGLVLM